MNIHVIGERKLAEAFELIGVRAHVPEAGTDVAEFVRELVRHDKVVLLLVQSGWMTELSDELLDDLSRTFGCLAVEVPGVNQPTPDSSGLRKALQSVVGAAS